MCRPAGAPADNPASVGIDDEGHIDELRPGAHICEVRDLQHVRPWRMEPPVDVIERTRRRFILDRRTDRLAANDALKTHRPHQARHGANPTFVGAGRLA